MIRTTFRTLLLWTTLWLWFVGGLSLRIHDLVALDRGTAVVTVAVPDDGRQDSARAVHHCAADDVDLATLVPVASQPVERRVSVLFPLDWQAPVWFVVGRPLGDAPKRGPPV